MRLVLCLFVLSGLAALWGCGDAPARPEGLTVTGKVLYANGQPVTAGRIYFYPDSKSGAQEWADLGKDGTFKIDSSKGGGLIPADYTAVFEEAAGKKSGLPADYLSRQKSPWKVSISSSNTNIELRVK